jgi:iron complex outermembrane recepter protein
MRPRGVHVSLIVPGRSCQRDVAYEGGIGTLAASLNYKINDYLALTFDGLNLNNPVLKYTNPQQPQAFYSNARQYFRGVRLSL